MNRAPTHEQVRDMLPAAALEILDPTEFQQVLVHTDDCAPCAQLLGEYREVAAALATLLPREELVPARSASLRNRLMARVQAEPRQWADDPRRGMVVPSAPRTLIMARWAGWAVAAGLGGVLLMHHSVHRPLAYGWLVAGVLTVVVVALAVYALIQRRQVSVLRERLTPPERPEAKAESGRLDTNGHRR